MDGHKLVGRDGDKDNKGEGKMNEIELCVHGEGLAENAVIRVTECRSIGDLVDLALKSGLAHADREEYFVFIDGKNGALDHDTAVVEVGIRHLHHVHLHRCKSLQVHVAADSGPAMNEEFAPSSTGREVKEWVAKELKLSVESIHLLTKCGEEVADRQSLASLAHNGCVLHLILRVREHERSYVVEVYNEDSGRSKRLHATAATLIGDLIQAMYDRFGVERRTDDRLRCECSSEDVFGLAGLTVEKYLAAGHCPELGWLFASGHGGA